MNSAVFFLFLFVGSSLGLPMRGGKCPAPSSSPSDFDMNKFLGLWYEIKRSESSHENGLKCNTASYSLLPNGEVNVTTSGIEESGKRINAHMIANQVTSDLPNYMGVTIAPEVPPASYWIVETDFVTYSAVLSCVQITEDISMPLGWIMSRTPQLDASIEERLTKVLASNGVDELVASDQPSDCTY